MRRFILFLIATCCTPIAVLAFSGGSGTENDPFIISSAEDLRSIPDKSTDCFILKADIPSFAGTWKTFCGKLDGNGHAITLEQKYSHGVDDNSYIDSYSQYFGIFKECTGATIINLTINGTQEIMTRNYAKGTEDCEYWNKWSNIDLYFHFYLTQVYIGSICGKATSTTFIGCASSSSIEFAVSSDARYDSQYLGIASDSWIGGLVGLATNCNFSECSASGSITTDLIADASRSYWSGSGIYQCIENNGCGGLAGGIEQSTISDSFSTVDITDDDKLSLGVGGLVGYARNSELNRSYARSSILNYGYSCGALVYSGNSKLNSCIGYSKDIQQINDLTFENCYLTTLEEETDQLKKVDPTMLYMEQWYAENCPNWDFENTWYLPATSDAMPLFRIEPSISWEGVAKYGSTMSFKSTNPYTKLEILPDNGSNITIDGSSVTYNKAGEIKINIRQNSVTPYKPISKSITFNVERIPLSISTKDVEMEYGNSPNLENILIFDGFINDDDQNSLRSLPNIYCGATAKSDVGTYNIVLQGGYAENYYLLLTNGTLNVVPRSLEVIPRSSSRKYGSPNPSFTVEFSGFAEGQDENMITEYPVVTTQATVRSDAGKYNLVCRGGTVHPNYKFIYKTGVLTIQKANLAIKAEDKERYIGEFNPTFTLSFSGFRNEDNEFALEQLPTISCDADINSPAGIYPIVLEGGYDKNYEYQLQNGVLNIRVQSGIDEITIDDLDENCTIYTLQGIKIQSSNNIRPGYYIVIKHGVSYKLQIH